MHDGDVMGKIMYRDLLHLQDSTMLLANTTHDATMRAQQPLGHGIGARLAQVFFALFASHIVSFRLPQIVLACALAVKAHSVLTGKRQVLMQATTLSYAK